MDQTLKTVSRKGYLFKSPQEITTFSMVNRTDMLENYGEQLKKLSRWKNYSKKLFKM